MEAEDLNWRKSTRSGGASSSCVEAANDERAVYIRDTKQRHMAADERTTLAVPPAAFRGLISRIKES